MPESVLTFSAFLLWVALMLVNMVARGDTRNLLESTEQRLSRLEEESMRVRGDEQDTMIQERLSLLRRLGGEQRNG